MMHWERPFLQHAWTRTTNDIIAQQCRSHPADDDVLAIIDSFDFLTTEDKTAIVTDNPLRVFPLLAKSPALQKQPA